MPDTVSDIDKNLLTLGFSLCEIVAFHEQAWIKGDKNSTSNFQDSLKVVIDALTKLGFSDFSFCMELSEKSKSAFSSPVGQDWENILQSLFGKDVDEIDLFCKPKETSKLFFEIAKGIAPEIANTCIGDKLKEVDADSIEDVVQRIADELDISNSDDLESFKNRMISAFNKCRRINQYFDSAHHSNDRKRATYQDIKKMVITYSPLWDMLHETTDRVIDYVFSNFTGKNSRFFLLGLNTNILRFNKIFFQKSFKGEFRSIQKVFDFDDNAGVYFQINDLANLANNLQEYSDELKLNDSIDKAIGNLSYEHITNSRDKIAQAGQELCSIVKRHYGIETIKALTVKIDSREGIITFYGHEYDDVQPLRLRDGRSGKPDNNYEFFIKLLNKLKKDIDSNSKKKGWLGRAKIFELENDKGKKVDNTLEKRKYRFKKMLDEHHSKGGPFHIEKHESGARFRLSGTSVEDNWDIVIEET